MNIWEKLKGIIKKQKGNTAPLIIIQKDSGDSETKEYSSIEKAIADFETDITISKEKLELLKESLCKLKHRSSIRITNGKIVE